MPGSSLWLLPPADHPLNSPLDLLIKQTSAHFGSQHLFLPHVTLTSEIPAPSHSSDPQAWLEKLPFPAKDEVRVKLGHLQSEDVFFRKLYIKVGKEDVSNLGKIARRAVSDFEEEAKAQQWANESYNPHLSLLYHDCPRISQVDIEKIEAKAREIGVSLEGKGDLGGWIGGRVVLVPTDRPINEWSPIAERAL